MIDLSAPALVEDRWMAVDLFDSQMVAEVRAFMERLRFGPVDRLG